MRDVSQSQSVSDKAKQCSELGLIKRNIRDILLVVEDIRNVNSCALTAIERNEKYGKLQSPTPM